MLPVGFLQAQTSDDKIEYAENGTGPVATFTATDPENAGAITWSLMAGLADDDDEDFTIDGGVLSFKESPDFENSTGGGPDEDDTSTTYTVTVRATDADFQPTDKLVTIEVTNVDEAGTVKLTTNVPAEADGTTIADGLDMSAIAPHPGVTITANLSDDDDRVRDENWQWSRSSTSGGSYINIAEKADGDSYMPTAGDVGYYLRLTVTYKDKEGSDKTATARSMHPVQAIRLPNAGPVFTDEDDDVDGKQDTRSVIENAEAGTNVGAPIRAADANSDILSYGLHATGDNVGFFTVDPATGQIKVAAGASLNAEDDETKQVFIIASDPNRQFDSISVTITIDDDQDESPVIIGAASNNVTGTVADGFSLVETVTTTDSLPSVADFGATDPDEDNEAIENWALSGQDAGDFTLSPDAGVLAFKVHPNYERPADADMNNVYKVTVVSTDDDGNRGEQAVDIMVTNAMEEGTVTFSAVQARVGVPLTASLNDPDGGVANLTWQWNDGTVDIAGATSATYTPVAVVTAIMVTASYTDAESLGVVRTAEAEIAVVGDTRNKAPEFGDQDPDTPGDQTTAASRSVAENSVAGTAVGMTITATDVNTGTGPSDDRLTYALSGTDTSSFDVDSSTGQIGVSSGTKLDYETKSTYNVTLTVTDSFGLNDSIAVAINITDMNEGPAITGTSAVEYVENGDGFRSNFHGGRP